MRSIPSKMYYSQSLSLTKQPISVTICSSNPTQSRMPLSMKKQRKNELRRQQRDLQRKMSRKLAAQQLKDNNSLNLRGLSGITGVTRSTIHDIKQKIARNDDQGLRTIVSPKKRAGAQRVLSDEEEQMISTHLLWSARRVFAADNSELKSLMGKIANDGRKRTFKSGVPSDDAIRSFRARHPELRYRKSEGKDRIKLKDESFEHVNSYASVLKSVQSGFPGIFGNGDLVWNMDETHVDGEFGERKKVFSCADTHHGSFTTTSKHAGDGRHVTSVIAVSASGKKAPPFFIVEGKRNMSNWYPSLNKDEYNLKQGHLRVLTETGWFPSDACVVMADKGSMEQRIIPIFMRHLNRFVRKFVPEEKHYVLLLDGHSSRKGIEWLELSQKMSCVVVQSPANTSHFLQPCDQQVNRTFQKTVRSVRDALCLASNNRVDMRSMQIKLMLGVMAMEAINAEDIRDSWAKTGLWPMDFAFPNRWRIRKDDITKYAKELVRAVDDAGPSGAPVSVKKRKSDKETFDILATIVDSVRSKGNAEFSKALRAVTNCLQKHETVDSILSSRCRKDSRTTASRISHHNPPVVAKPKNSVLPSGAPAEYLTHADVMGKRRELIAIKEAEMAAKHNARREQALKREQREEQKRKKALARAEAQAKRKRDSTSKAGLSRRNKKKKENESKTIVANEVARALLQLGGGGDETDNNDVCQQ